MAKFDKRDVALWKESRLEKVSSSTVSREWCSLSAVITHAKRDWGMSIADNPFHLLRRPASNKPREQRISAADIEMVMVALGYTPGTRPELQRHFVAWAFLFAIETAMRAGEILKLQADDINGKLATLRDTKNGYDRVVPLSAAARDLLALVDLPLPLSSRVLDTLFRRYRPAELAHIHFHDTRHEALSRLAKKSTIRWISPKLAATAMYGFCLILITIPTTRILPDCWISAALAAHPQTTMLRQCRKRIPKYAPPRILAAGV